LACWHAIHRSSTFALLLHLTAPTASGAAVAGTPKKAVSGHHKPHALPGLVHGLQKIATDFERYLNYDAQIQSHLNARADKDFASECVRRAVDNEIESFKALLAMGDTQGLVLGAPVPPLESFEQYIKFRGDLVLVSLGYPKIYNADTPFPWLANAMAVEGEEATENRNATPAKQKQAKAAVMGSATMLPPTPASARKEKETGNMFTLDADF
jgi:hypothetical protein